MDRLGEIRELRLQQIALDVLRLDRVRVKGKDEPVSIYEPLGLVSQLENSVKEELQRWNAALSLYRGRNWDQAELQLRALSDLRPDCYLYCLYLERVTHYRDNSPAEGWDGVTTFETK